MEQFAYCNTDHFETTNSNRTIKKKKSGWNTYYGNKILNYDDNVIHKWKFKMIQLANGASFIGIDEASRKYMDRYFPSGLEGYGYGYNGYNGKKYNKSENSSYGDKFAAGDTVTMILNLKDKTLSYQKNNSLPTVAFTIKNTNKGYCMAVSLHNTNDEVTLLSYENDYGQDDAKSDETINQQNAQIDELKKRNSVLNNELNQMKEINSQNVNEISMCKAKNKSLNDLVNNYKEKEAKLNNELNAMKTTTSQLQIGLSERDETINHQNEEVDELKTKISALNKELNEMKTKISQLQRDNGKLMEEHKECQLIINKLREENQRLKLENIDISKYEEWNHEQILMWILSLDKRFAKYEQKLQKSLSEEAVMGVNLKEVDAIDIKGWGIVNFNDKKYLMKEIQKLIQQNVKYDANNNDINEGNNVAPTAYI